FMRELGYGKEYRYPHDFKGAFVPDESYFPDNYEPLNFYSPTEYGKEKIISERLSHLWPARFNKIKSKQK
ncbi:MAG: replication-associated recombination protein A, partial [Candidatus Riflebacteria bacterium]